MKNTLTVLFVSLLIMVQTTSCTKQELSPQTPSPQKAEEVVLYSAGNDLSLAAEEASEWYNFSVGNTQGRLYMRLDQEGNLLESRMTSQLYEFLLNRTSAGEIALLPQNLLNYSKSLRKQKYDFWRKTNFIPPMSREKFNQEWEKCTNKPSDVGAILCAVNLIIEAVRDCLTATPATQSIHCW